MYINSRNHTNKQKYILPCIYIHGKVYNHIQITKPKKQRQKIYKHINTYKITNRNIHTYPTKIADETHINIMNGEKEQSQ